MRVIIRMDMGPAVEGVVAEVQWPPGWALPRVGEQIELESYGVHGKVLDITWHARIPDGYPHLTEWSVHMNVR